MKSIFRVFPLLVCALGCVAQADFKEGRVAKLAVFNQTDGSGATPDSQPFHFVASIRNSLSNHTAAIVPPAASTWSEIPFTVTEAANLSGAHFYYDAGFADLDELDSAFPAGDYVLSIHREFESAVSDFDVTLSLGPEGALPVPNLEITNTTWEDGALVLNPEAPILSYSGAGGNRFEWEMVGGGSGGGAGTATGSVDYSGMNWAFGRSFVGYIRLVHLDDQVIVEDANAPSGHTTASSTYEAMRGAELRFSMRTMQAPADFSLLEARFTSSEGVFDLRPALLGEIQNNGIVARMDVREWTDWAAGDEPGVVLVRYENEEGRFEVELPYSRDNYDARVVLPTKSAQRVPVGYADWARQHFPPANWGDPLVWSQDSDPDQDGRDNVVEYADGTDPMSPEAPPLRQFSITEVGGHRYPCLNYSRGAATRAVISYEQSLDLSSWVPLLPQEFVTPSADDESKEEVTIIGPGPVDWRSTWFLRLHYSEPDGVTSLGEVGLIIVEALYGADETFSDVTGILQSSVIGNTLTIQVTNTNMGGDPIVGVHKTLTVRYFLEGIEQTVVVDEGDSLSIP